MARAPRHYDVLTPEGVTRVRIRYLRPFQQVVPIQFCRLTTAGISHNCDEMACWPDGHPDHHEEWKP